MEIIAQHCNEQKLAAKGAQEKSDLIFLCAFLRLYGARTEVHTQAMCTPRGPMARVNHCSCPGAGGHCRASPRQGV
jgi:hypothetical protein